MPSAAGQTFPSHRIPGTVFRFLLEQTVVTETTSSTSSIEKISSEVHNFLKTLTQNIAGTDASHENGRGSHIVCLSCRNGRLYPCQM